MKRPACFFASVAIAPYPGRRPGILSCSLSPLPPPGGVSERRATGQMTALLKTLIGRQVSLQVGGLVHQGKVVSADPVILVGGDGRASFIRAEAILVVAF